MPGKTFQKKWVCLKERRPPLEPASIEINVHNLFLPIATFYESFSSHGKNVQNETLVQYCSYSWLGVLPWGVFQTCSGLDYNQKTSPHLCPTTVYIGCQSAIKFGKLGAEPKALFKVLQNSNGEVRRLQRSGETLSWFGVMRNNPSMSLFLVWDLFKSICPELVDLLWTIRQLMDCSRYVRPA